MKASFLQWGSRLSFFALVGAGFGARDMCLGNDGPPPDPPAPVDAGEDAPDGAMSKRPALPTPGDVRPI
ncbi:hypothetical protein [Polyangium jinanense]|uniref:Uncharacterized protein n=1 Tax=Polyangium jinanense TaxID=2829994 RepID=A0A9X4AW76_9BACT|nr:hypothetical protein [Polyangium jinanense]MDC3961178.1 hypothetical protein [Polyangium jinanense]MDC3986481.1 hypothetical protein [Polyangium jinanense]